VNLYRPTFRRYLLLLVSSLVFALPLIWMFTCSLKSQAELVEDPYSLLPTEWNWHNYPDAVQSMPYLRYLGNSLFLCTLNIIASLFSCSLVAYGFSRLRWRGRRLLFGILIATMLLPWHVTMIPRFLLFRELHLYNSMAALIIPSFLGDAFFVFLLRQFFISIPEELSEAARLDGLSEWGIYWRIILPLSKPALATVALFQFIATWNDFSGPLLYLNDPEKFPLAYGLEQFVSSYGDQTHWLLSAAVLFTLPVLILFFFTQRTFLKGIATTGIKG